MRCDTGGTDPPSWAAPGVKVSPSALGKEVHTYWLCSCRWLLLCCLGVSARALLWALLCMPGLSRCLAARHQLALGEILLVKAMAAPRDPRGRETGVSTVYLGYKPTSPTCCWLCRLFLQAAGDWVAASCSLTPGWLSGEQDREGLQDGW